ncbi:MAG: HEAT repeat domain-containing protein [Deltaproteobacteria bacterium]|nr:HEAT repeat domain-containing protein [Deltaproteobacteria bacterium]
MRSIPTVALSLAVALAACGPSTAAKHAQALYDRGDYQGAVQAAPATSSDAALVRVGLRARLAAGDARGAVQAYAAWRAGRDDDRVALRLLAEDTLAQALTSPSTAVKVQAIEAIAAREIEALADDVTLRLGDREEQVLAAAAVAVLRGHPQAPDILASMLNAEDPIARAIAVRGMATKVGAHAADDLRNALRDPDPRVRRAAIVGLAPLADANTTSALIVIAAKDPDGQTRAAALTALGRGKRGRIDPVAHAALGDAFLGARLAAIDLVAAQGDHAAIDKLLTDADAIVAIHAARAAHAWNPTGAAAAIDRGLADADAATRSGALNLAVAALGKAAAGERAARVTADADVGVRLSAARVLASVGQRDQAIAIWTATLDARDGVAVEAQIAAAADLARAGEPRGDQALAGFATSGEPAQRQSAVASHAISGHITPGLVAALADSAPQVRVEAAATLWSLVRNADRAAD